jgi:LysM repeat protein
MRHIILTGFTFVLLATGCATQSPTTLSFYPADPSERRQFLARSIPADASRGSTYEVRVYIVTRGDTMAKISEQFRLTSDQLTALNPGMNWLRLKIGQRVVVYEQTNQ